MPASHLETINMKDIELKALKKGISVEEYLRQLKEEEDKNKPANHPPKATDVTSQTVKDDSTITIDLKQYVTDEDGGTPKVKIKEGPTVNGGSVRDNGDGTATYTPPKGTKGTTDKFTFTAVDEHGASSNEATVNVNVEHVNRIPTAKNANVNVNDDKPSIIDLRSYVSDEDGTPRVKIKEGRTPNGGHIKDNGDGTATYTPPKGTKGTADSFTFAAIDEQGASSPEAIVNVNVNHINRAPKATDVPTQTVKDDSTITIDLKQYVTDEDGGAPKVKIKEGPTVNGGSVRDNGDGTATYTPPKGTKGTTDKFTFTAVDDHGLPSNEASVNINVKHINRAPKATDVNGIKVNDDSTVTIDLKKHMSDEDGRTPAIKLGKTSNGGNVKDNGDGTVTYTPPANYQGPASFKFTAVDEEGDYSNEATVNIDVAHVNHAPKVVGDNISVNRNSELEVDFSSYMSDQDGDLLKAIIIASPQGASSMQGQFTPLGNNKYKYTPKKDFLGEEIITFKANDGRTDSSTATLTIKVVKSNQEQLIEKVTPYIETGKAWAPYIHLFVTSLYKTAGAFLALNGAVTKAQNWWEKYQAQKAKEAAETEAKRLDDIAKRDNSNDKAALDAQNNANKLKGEADIALEKLNDAEKLLKETQTKAEKLKSELQQAKAKAAGKEMPKTTDQVIQEIIDQLNAKGSQPKVIKILTDNHVSQTTALAITNKIIHDEKLGGYFTSTDKVENIILTRDTSNKIEVSTMGEEIRSSIEKALESGRADNQKAISEVTKLHDAVEQANEKYLKTASQLPEFSRSVDEAQKAYNNLANQASKAEATAKNLAKGANSNFESEKKVAQGQLPVAQEKINQADQNLNTVNQKYESSDEDLKKAAVISAFTYANPSEFFARYAVGYFQDGYKYLESHPAKVAGMVVGGAVAAASPVIAILGGISSDTATKFVVNYYHTGKPFAEFTDGFLAGSGLIATLTGSISSLLFLGTTWAAKTAIETGMWKPTYIDPAYASGTIDLGSLIYSTTYIVPGIKAAYASTKGASGHMILAAEIGVAAAHTGVDLAYNLLGNNDPMFLVEKQEAPIAKAAKDWTNNLLGNSTPLIDEKQHITTPLHGEL